MALHMNPSQKEIRAEGSAYRSHCHFGPTKIPWDVLNRGVSSNTLLIGYQLFRSADTADFAGSCSRLPSHRSRQPTSSRLCKHASLVDCGANVFVLTTKSASWLEEPEVDKQGSFEVGKEAMNCGHIEHTSRRP